MSAVTMAAFSSRSARAALSALDLGSRRALLCGFVMGRPFIDSSLRRVLDTVRSRPFGCWPSCNDKYDGGHVECQVDSERGASVRVTREQAAANREKILDVAGTLFRERGFDGIGVADIMKQAGLTHGGFYGHFGSKEDLAAEITARVLRPEGWAQRMTGTPNPTFAEVVRKYLTPRHREDAGHGCLFAALGSDVVRQPRSVRRAFTDGLRLRIKELQELLPGRAAARRRKAVATMVGLVGALILARAVGDPSQSKQILDPAG